MEVVRASHWTPAMRSTWVRLGLLGGQQLGPWAWLLKLKIYVRFYSWITVGSSQIGLK